MKALFYRRQTHFIHLHLILSLSLVLYVTRFKYFDNSGISGDSVKLSIKFFLSDNSIAPAVTLYNLGFLDLSYISVSFFFLQIQLNIIFLRQFEIVSLLKLYQGLQIHKSFIFVCLYFNLSVTKKNMKRNYTKDVSAVWSLRLCKK